MFVIKFILVLAVTTSALPAPQPLRKLPASRAHAYSPRDDGSVDGPSYLLSLNRTLQKYHSEVFIPSYPGMEGLLNKRVIAPAKVPLKDQNPDVLYYGVGYVGTANPQQFSFDFDTGSTDLFIPGPACTTSAGCIGPTKYSEHGTNKMTTTTITYGSGAVMGTNFIDKVCVAGLCARNQNVISLTQATGFSSSASDSLMGMGFTSIAASGQSGFFQTLMDEGSITNQEFSFYLGRVASGTDQASQLTLGGVDPTKYTGSMGVAIPVTTQGYWQIALDSVNVNGLSAGPTTKGQAAIDTGTTIILAPTLAAAAIFLAIPGAIPVPIVLSGSAQLTIYVYPCNSYAAKKVSITFGGTQYSINPLDFSLGKLSSSLASILQSDILAFLLNLFLGQYCLSAIAAADINPSQNLYVVGDTFLKNWHSTFSYTSAPGSKPGVSFAKAVGNQ